MREDPPPEVVASISPGQRARENPFPGLRPFEADETYLFFGREGQSDEILRILGQHRFVAVVGTSGSGKSSLVRAGMIPSLEAGFMAAAGSSWRFAIMRPGEQRGPIASLAHRLADPEVFGPSEIPGEELTRIIDTTLRRSSYGLIEAAKQLHLLSGENLLVLVDQFEELFRLRNSRARNAAEDVEAAFVRLLLEATRQTELPIYVVITMRSDFIGDCSEFRDLPEALNHAQFLIPRMTRDQRREAIEGPIAVSGATISPRLVQRMLNDVGDNPDQLPILQHALMRTWAAWYAAGKLDQPLDLDHYQSIGGWENALSLHADEAFNELDAHGKEIAERVFKALVERTADSRETRRPGQVNLLAAVADASADAVIGVIDHFRLPGRTFLMPPAAIALNADSVVDISHESLIRLWKRLRDWVAEEAESAVIYRRLADVAQRYKQGRAGLWRDPDLKIALQWQEKTRPNTAWAERYAPGFEDAVEFLKLSHQDQEKDRAARESKERLLRFRLHLLRAAVAVLVLVALYAVISANKFRKEKVVAQEAQKAAEARELRTYAYRTKNDSPEVSALLAIESARTMRELNKYTVATDGILREALRIVKPTAAYPAELPNSPALRCHSDPITTSKRGRIVRTRFNQAGAKIDFAPVGGSFAAVCEAGTNSQPDPAAVAGVVDLGHGDRVTRLDKSSEATAVAFTPDASFVAAGGEDGNVALFDAKTGQAVWQRKLPGPVETLTIGRTGRWLAVGFGKATRPGTETGGGLALLSVKNGSPSPVPEVRGPVIDAEFSPDGQTIGVANWNGEAVLFSPESGKELMPRVVRMLKLQNQTDLYNVTTVAFSSNGRYVAFGFGATGIRTGAGLVVVYDTATMKQIGRDISVTSAVAGIRFSPVHATSQPDEIPALAILSREDVWIDEFDPTAGIWIPRVGTSIRNASPNTIYSDAVFSPDGEYLVVSDSGGFIYFYDPSMLETVTYRRFINLGQLIGLKFNHSGELLAAVGTERTEVFDLDRDLLASRAVTLHDASPNPKGPVAFSRNFTTAVVPTEDGAESVFTLDNKGQFQAHKLIAETAITQASTAEQAEVSGAPAVSASSVPAMGRVPSASSSLTSLAIAPDGKRIAFSDGLEIELEDAATGAVLWKIPGDAESLALSPDGRWIAAAEMDPVAEREVRIHFLDASNGSHHWVSKALGRAPVRALAFSPTGRWIAVATDLGLFVGDVTTRDFSAVAGIGNASAVAFSDDDKQLAVTGDDGAGFVVGTAPDVSGFSVSSRFDAPSSRVEELEFSPDGHYLMAHDSTNMVHLFDLKSQNVEISNFNGFKGVFAAAFDDDSPKNPKLFLAISNPDSISILRSRSSAFVDPATVINEICGSLTRNLTCDEWHDYFPNADYRATCPNLPLPPPAPVC